MKTLRVSDVMTHLVVTLRPADTIPKARQQLLSNRISGAPVVEEGKLVGVVSETDLVRLYASPAFGDSLLTPSREGPRGEFHVTTVGDVMSRNVVSIGQEESVWRAASLIDRYGVRRLPVVDVEGYVVGVLARSDLVRAMARSDEAVATSPG
jgi:CBS domain-containing protein